MDLIWVRGIIAGSLRNREQAGSLFNIGENLAMAIASKTKTNLEHQLVAAATPTSSALLAMSASCLQAESALMPAGTVAELGAVGH